MRNAQPTNPIAGRYEIDGVIGEGGMGCVYGARDLRLGRREVAVKVLTAPGHSMAARARFDREVRLTASLESKHIVKVYDTGRLDDHRPFVVMERLPGHTIDDELRTYGAMAPERAVGLIDGVLMGLAVAHAAGVVHRDVKPGNVFLAEDGHGGVRSVLLDFGIARPYRSPDVRLTGQNALLGTPAFMSPEQIKRGVLDGRSDLYAAGVMLHKMLRGAHPFEIEPPPDAASRFPRHVRLLWFHLNQALPVPDGVSPGLAQVLERLCAKDLDTRYGSATDAMVALRRCPEGARLASLDASRLEALAPKTVPVELDSFDLPDIADTIATPSAMIGRQPPPASDASRVPDWVVTLAIAVGVMVAGALVYILME